jgi:hypothetical protein
MREKNAGRRVHRALNGLVKVTVAGCNHAVVQVIRWPEVVGQWDDELLQLTKESLDLLTNHFDMVLLEVATFKPVAQATLDLVKRTQLE